LTAADRLAGALLPHGRPGRPVLLACSDQALAGAGLDGRALVAAVRAGGGLAGAARAAAAFEAAPRPRPVPAHLPALCLLVLAASLVGLPAVVARFVPTVFDLAARLAAGFR